LHFLFVGPSGNPAGVVLVKKLCRQFRNGQARRAGPSIRRAISDISASMLLYGKLDFFMGGDQIGDFICAESKLPLVAVAADFQKSPQIFMSHPGAGLDKWEDLSTAKPVYVGAGAIQTFYAWLRLVYGFKDENIRPYNFNSAAS
jgi:hypothetical protein